MSLFQCDRCGCMENTALSHMSRAHLNNMVCGVNEAIAIGLAPGQLFGKYCSACSPKDGQTWHGKFERTFYPLGTMMTNDEGNLVPRASAAQRSKEGE